MVIDTGSDHWPNVLLRLPLQRAKNDLPGARLLGQVRHLQAGNIEFHYYPSM